LVTGLNENFDENALKLIFENKKLSDGGPIEDLNLDKQKRTALITFRKPEGSCS
jgi:hypothetical protein